MFIAAGEGGGTGTGGSPIVAKIAREQGALTIAVVTRPFRFEGSRRAEAAEAGIDALHRAADTVIVIPNERLMSVLEHGTSVVQAFRVCDDLLRQGVQGICDMITLPGLINLDFADVRAVIRDAGTALLGIGYASGGQPGLRGGAGRDRLAAAGDADRRGPWHPARHHRRAGPVAASRSTRPRGWWPRPPTRRPTSSSAPPWTRTSTTTSG